jgi:hypothetical protein
MQKIITYVMVIFVIFALLGQLVTFTPVEANDARTNAEELSKKIQAELDNAKSELKTVKNAWRDAKKATDTAKDKFNQNKTEENLAAISLAKQNEASAYKTYQTVLEKVKNFEIQLDNSLNSIEKAIKNNADSVSVESEERKQSKEITKKIQEELEKEKSKLENAKKVWKDAKIATDLAQLVFEQNANIENLDALNQAKQDEETALINYKKILADVQDFKPDITPDVIEKAKKTTDDTSVKSKSGQREKNEEFSKKIQAQLDQTKSNLSAATKTWNDSKDAKDLAKQSYIQNPTDENLAALNQAKQDEAIALFFYHKALLDLQFFELKIHLGF